MASLSNSVEFKSAAAPTTGSAVHPVMSMDDVRSRMKARGLDLVTRDNDKEKKVQQEFVDPVQEEERKKEFLQQCIQAGLNWGECDPFAPEMPDEQPGVKHNRQAFFYSTRFNSHFKEAKTMYINLASRQIVYLDKNQQALVKKNIVGSKVSCDLVSKTKFHVWYLGDKAPINHTLHDEAEFHGVAADDDDEEEDEDTNLELDKFEEHSPRDNAANVASLRTMLNFPIIEVHKGPLEKRGKSGLTHNSRYCRVVNGHLLIYRSDRAEFPLDSVCLFGVRIKQKPRHTIKLKGKERSYYLKCSGKQDRDQWLTALNLGKVRGIHEWKMTVVHLAFQRKKERALRHSRSMHSTHSLKNSHSSTTLNRGYSMSLDPNQQAAGYDQWIDDLNAIKTSPSKDSIIEEHGAPSDDNSPGRRKGKLRKSGSRHSQRSGLNSARRAASKKSLVAEVKEMGPASARSASPPKSRPRQKSYGGGYAEFQVHLDTLDGRSTPIGFIEVEDNDTLEKFRKKIMKELDNVPAGFIFLRDSVPVGKRQEHSKMIEYVVDEYHVVHLREEPSG